MSSIRKTIDVHIDRTIEQEVNIYHADIIRYIKESHPSEIELNEIIEAVNGRKADVKFIINTLDDEIKIELLSQAYKKYSLKQLENLLKY